MRKIMVGVTVLAALAASGCLRKETAHALYLSGDGSVRWVTTESGVYSDEEEPAARFQEEQAYLGAALGGSHTVAQALGSLRPFGVVETTVLRDERPLHVVTQARFAGIDSLAQRALDEAGISGRARLVREHDRTSLIVTLDFGRPIVERDSALMRILEDGGSLWIVLTEGRFQASPDVEIVERVKATVSDDWLRRAQTAQAAGQAIEFRLSWWD